MFVCVGTIDEVNQEVTLPWVQPRVLDLAQVCMLEEVVWGLYK